MGSKLLYVTWFAGALLAQNATRFAPGIQPFLAIDAPVIALQHVRVIDGTGAPPSEDQTIVIDQGKIGAVGTA
jgi:hypothetical protein